MRNINEKFINDLLQGELSYFLNRVKNNRDILSLEVRNGYVNIYYKGGNLLKITQRKKGYSFHFDEKYCKNKGNDTSFSLLKALNPNDTDSYKAYFDLMMSEMDSWFEKHPKPERDYQHQLLVNNPEIIDIEYQIGRCMRLDMLCFQDGKLYIVENKYGIGAISGKAGLSAHYADICQVLNDTKLLNEMLDSICHISKAKKTLGLSEISIERSDINEIEIVFLLANYNSKSNTLSNELKKMNGNVQTGILMLDSDETKIDFGKARNTFDQL